MTSRPLDLLTKTLLEEAGPEVVTWLAGQKPLETVLVPTELVQAEVRIADHLVRAVLPGDPPRTHYFNVELQAGGDRRMGLRALVYWAKTKLRLEEKEKIRIGVSTFVVYLDHTPSSGCGKWIPLPSCGSKTQAWLPWRP